jgi:hypothetical protein
MFFEAAAAAASCFPGPFREFLRKVEAEAKKMQLLFSADERGW